MSSTEIIELWKKGFTVKQIVKEYVRIEKKKGNKVTTWEAQSFIEPIIFKFQTNLMKGAKKMIKISDLPAGMIVWKGYQILGITKATLPEKYYDNYCTKVPGNDLDYELVKEEK